MRTRTERPDPGSGAETRTIQIDETEAMPAKTGRSRAKVQRSGSTPWLLYVSLAVAFLIPTMVLAMGAPLWVFVVALAAAIMIAWYAWTSEKMKPKHPSRPTPMSWHSLLCYRIMLLLRVNYLTSWVPESENDLDTRLRHQAYRQPGKFFMAINTKGGCGKTTLTTWLACIIMSVIKSQVILLEANENKGGTAKRLGVDRSETVALRWFVKNHHDYETLANLYSILGMHQETGVRVVASDPASSALIGHDDFRSMLEKLRHAHTLIADCGNGVNWTSNKVSAQEADLLMIPASTVMPESYGDARDTINVYKDDSDNGITSDKLDRAFIVLLGYKRRDRAKHAGYFGVPKEQVFVIPSDRYMKDTTKVVNLHKIRRRTRKALKYLALRAYESVGDAETVVALPADREPEAVASTHQRDDGQTLFTARTRGQTT